MMQWRFCTNGARCCPWLGKNRGQQMRHQSVIEISVQRLSCTACGAEANASCDCGKPYVPARQRAKEAIEANPQKSNRAIAADEGIALGTVNNARNELTEQGGSVEPRIGLDGKVRRLPVRDEPDSSDADH